MRDWSFQDDGPLSLSGQWQLYSSILLAPGESSPQDAGKPLYMQVPDSWNNYPARTGLRSGQGYATYKLKLLLDPQDKLLEIRVPNIFTSYKLWVDDKLLAEAGKVGTSKSDSVAEQVPKIVTFDGNQREINLTIQVSNFHFRKGGIWVDLRMGTHEQITTSQMRTTIQEVTILGSLLIIGLFHIGLYAFRRQERFTLNFGLLCLSVAVRTSVTGNIYLLQLFPSISWETAMKMEYIAFALSAVSGSMYISELFPRDYSRRVTKVIKWFGYVICLFVLATPPIIFSRTVMVIQFLVLAASIFILFVMAKALKHRRDGAGFILAGVSVFIITIVNDILFYNELLAGAQLVPFGLFFFMLMQSFIISNRFSKALHRVEHVSKELRELNTHLEERIADRTEELRSANNTLALTNKELAKVEASRSQLMTNISHDLRTPMTLIQGYLEAMQDGVIKSEEQRQRYIRMMLGKVNGLNRLIQDLFELTKLESGQLKFHYTEVPLEHWIASLNELYELDVSTKGIRFTCKFHHEEGEEKRSLAPMAIITLQMDQQRMERVISNLIYNAVKYTAPGGKIALSFSYRVADNEVLVQVQDTGQGIEADHLPYIFDRFYKKDAARNSAEGGSGLGLAIAKEIVEAHGGQIGAVSEPGEGTTIWLTLPVMV
ncbi:signal transduction histidine kinase [Paenibacillus phyllosphaerae]|uniref:histidine kinase n=1 Tax=Paenibacillus phyllosphaerae TaxID=274593 RepID=A0A7W5AX54_9BACL|nr:sensor histidine kinase [Paenibacillus phyllosphaerae]MBB3110420.1 signal transduction histidine kinase [Paenibacillus phyllosphaerae]